MYVIVYFRYKQPILLLTECFKKGVDFASFPI